MNSHDAHHLMESFVALHQSLTSSPESMKPLQPLTSIESAATVQSTEEGAEDLSNTEQTGLAEEVWTAPASLDDLMEAAPASLDDLMGAAPASLDDLVGTADSESEGESEGEGEGQR